MPTEPPATGAGLEAGLLPALQALATDPAARGLRDDCAVADWPLGAQLVVTHDLLAEGVHFTAACPPADIGWKLVAVNLSDLAADGARPLGILLGAGIGRARGLDWATELVRGVGQALRQFDVALLGGDTIRAPDASVLAATAIGWVPAGTALARSGAQAADELWLSGDIGGAGLGLKVALGARSFGAADAAVLKRLRRPQPRIALGLALRGIATAAMDVSDGLLLDAGRLAAASGLQAQIESAQVPWTPAAPASVPRAELAAAGDDYELLFTAPAARRAAVLAAAAAARIEVSCIGRMQPGAGVTLDGAPPRVLGYQHF